MIVSGTRSPIRHDNMIGYPSEYRPLARLPARPPLRKDMHGLRLGRSEDASTIHPFPTSCHFPRPIRRR